MTTTNFKPTLDAIKTAAKAASSKIYNRLNTPTVLGIPTCCPMYKAALELGELYELRDLKSTPFVEARIAKIHKLYSPSQIKIMHQIIEFNKSNSATTVEEDQNQP